MLIQREVRDQPLQSTVFFFQLPQPPKFAHSQVDVLLLPGVEGLLDHTVLPAQIDDGVPDSACRRAQTIGSSVNVDRVMGPLLSSRTAQAARLLYFCAAVVFTGDVNLLNAEHVYLNLH